MGTKAPLIHNICMIDTLEYHLSVMEITINSSAMIPSPSMAGNEMKAVKRNILRNTRLMTQNLVKTLLMEPIVLLYGKIILVEEKMASYILIQYPRRIANKDSNPL